jgi:DNA-3-methyladenine glycosylase
LSNILPRKFFERNSTEVARDLIGKELVRVLRERTLRGVIVEAEAYGGSDDPASHAYRGMTERNRVMFGRAGIAYVYFTYGFHYCLNVVTGNEGVATAVLTRALEPVDGIDIMKKRRGNPPREKDLANGPGKICQALGIDRSSNGTDMTILGSKLRIERGRASSLRSVASSERIGIKVAVDKQWRFYDPASEFVSRFSKSAG